MLLNLVQACNTNNEAILFGFIQKYADKYRYNEETMSFLKRLVTYAIAYYNDFVADTRNPTKPEIEQREALSALIDALASIQNSNAEADEIQSTIFNVGRKFYSDDLKKWFETLYQTLFGTTCGPRMGTFVKLYGIENSIQLINSRMSAH
jgi:lysyl-tRNA synthetase class 1